VNSAALALVQLSWSFKKVLSNGKCGLISHCYFECNIQIEDVFLLRFVDNAFFFGKNFELHSYCSEMNVGWISFLKSQWHYCLKYKLLYSVQQNFCTLLKYYCYDQPSLITDLKRGNLQESYTLAQIDLFVFSFSGVFSTRHCPMKTILLSKRY